MKIKDGIAIYISLIMFILRPSAISILYWFKNYDKFYIWKIFSEIWKYKNLYIFWAIPKDLVEL